MDAVSNVLGDIAFFLLCAAGLGIMLIMGLIAVLQTADDYYQRKDAREAKYGASQSFRSPKLPQPVGGLYSPAG